MSSSRGPVPVRGSGARLRLGVLGWPVAHSRSPQMMNAAFAALALPGWRYQLLPVPPELFAETVRALPAAGFAGANVTVPHKQAALALADQASDAAREIGAANTLSFRDDGTIAAENTDAPGLLAALPLDVAGRSALVLGAGGSARAVLWALLRAGARVSVWNRSAQRAEQLAAELGGVAVPEPVPADLLVNCTSVGLETTAKNSDSDDNRSHRIGRRSRIPDSASIPDSAESRDARPARIPDSATAEAQLNQLALRADQLARYPYVVDLVYSDSETPLLAAARRAGARTVDGTEMLVRQGAVSFELWTGARAPLAVMRAAARRPLS